MTVKIASVQGYALTKPNQGAKVSNVHGYALATPPAPMQLREVRGYSMVTLPLSINLRSVSGYAMASWIALPKGQTFSTALMTMILTQSKFVRPTTHFNLGVVEVGDVAGYNSKVKLTPTALAQLSGEMYFHYNRVYMNRMADLSSLVIGAAANTHALIPQINTLTGMVLTTADIVNTAIAAGSVEVTLTAADASYLFVPGTTVQVGNTPTLASLFKNDLIQFT